MRFSSWAPAHGKSAQELFKPDPATKAARMFAEKEPNVQIAKTLAKDLNGKSADEVIAYMNDPFTEAFLKSNQVKIAIRDPEPPKLPEPNKFGVTQYRWVLDNGMTVRLKVPPPAGLWVDTYRIGPTYSVSFRKLRQGQPLPPGEDAQNTDAFKFDANGTPVPAGPDDVEVPKGLSPAAQLGFQKEAMDRGHQKTAR